MSKSASIPQPGLFISHGTPMAALLAEDPEGDEYVLALREFVRGHERPKAILVLSAHGISPDEMIEVSAAAHPKQFHDFGGFPPALYQVRYACPGQPELAARVCGLLGAEGLSASISTDLPLDHGVWVPVMLMHPGAEIPVVQVSMPISATPEFLLKMGKALAPLRREGVRILGSGGAVHNLGELEWHSKHGKPAAWAVEFETWIKDHLAKKDVSTLARFLDEGPNASLAHPTTEHFLPIFFTLGAALPEDDLIPIHDGIEYRTLSMLCFALGSAATSRLH